MKEFKVDFYEYNPNFISFTSNIFSFIRLFFLLEKNFKRETKEHSLGRIYLDLNKILNLKQLKVDVI